MEKQFPKVYKIECSLTIKEFEQFEIFRKARGTRTKAEIMRMALKSYMSKWTEKKVDDLKLETLERRVRALEVLRDGNI